MGMSERDREAALVRQRVVVDRVVAFYRWDADVDVVRVVLEHPEGCECPVCS